MKKRTKKKGFTLIELIVVIAILGILAAVLIPRFTGFQDKARRTQMVTDAHQIQTAVDSKLAESLTGTIPVSADKAADLALGAGKSIILISGVDDSKIVTFSNTEDGDFSFTEEINSQTYTGSRTGTGTVTVTP